VGGKSAIPASVSAKLSSLASTAARVRTAIARHRKASLEEDAAGRVVGVPNDEDVFPDPPHRLPGNRRAPREKRG